MERRPRFAMPAAPAGRFRRVPPAIFPAILGLLGLGLVWRRAAASFAFDGSLVELYLGAVTLLTIGALIAYGTKVALRPGSLSDDLRVLPGRTGLAAMTMCVMLLAAVCWPYTVVLSAILLALGFAGHLVIAGLTARLLWIGAPGTRDMTPAMHLVFVGFIVAPLAALPMGLVALSAWLAIYSVSMSLLLCAVTLPALLGGNEPAPLRPLHAIHIAPAGLIATTAMATGMDGLAFFMLAWGGLLLMMLVLRVAWLTEAGFSPLWSAFTFPLVAYSGAILLAEVTYGWSWARFAGAIGLVLATLITLPIAHCVLRAWGEGSLAQKTNASIA